MLIIFDIYTEMYVNEMSAVMLQKKKNYNYSPLLSPSI